MHIHDYYMLSIFLNQQFLSPDLKAFVCSRIDNIIKINMIKLFVLVPCIHGTKLYEKSSMSINETCIHYRPNKFKQL